MLYVTNKTRNTCALMGVIDVIAVMLTRPHISRPRPQPPRPRPRPWLSRPRPQPPRPRPRPAICGLRPRPRPRPGLTSFTHSAHVTELTKCCATQAVSWMSTWFRTTRYPGKWGGKMNPQSTFASISETVRYTAMCFSDIVQHSEGYLSPYKVLSYLYQKCGHDGVKPEVHFRKSAKVVCPTVNLTITSSKHFHRLLSYFHGHLAWICCWHSFLMSIFIAICDPENMCLVFGNLQVYFLSEVITTSGFERDRDAILVIWHWHVPHDVVSHFIEFMDT